MASYYMVTVLSLKYTWGLRTLGQVGSQACSLWLSQPLTICLERVLPSGYSQAVSSRAFSPKSQNTILLSTALGGIFSVSDLCRLLPEQ